MKAGVVHAKNDIRYEEIEKPQPKKGQVLIKVKYTGCLLYTSNSSVFKSQNVHNINMYCS